MTDLIKECNPPYREASFLVCDSDNTRPRIVNGWDLLERVLTVNIQHSMEEGHDLYQVRMWLPEYGHLTKIDLSVISEKPSYGAIITTWGLFMGSNKIARFDVRARRHRAPASVGR